MKIEIKFLEGPSRTKERDEIMGVIWRTIRYAAKGVALSFGVKISMRRF